MSDIEINLETVTQALSQSTTNAGEGFEHDSTYYADAKNGRLVVTWFVEDSNTSVTFTVTVSDVEIEDLYPDYDEDGS